MRRTKAEAEKTREAIITASIEVFLERGVTRATLDEIARAAGVTRGAIYWHFRDKLEIFLALERRANLPNKELGERLKARLAADPRLDPLDELADTIREGLQSFEANLERRSILTILWTRCEYVMRCCLCSYASSALTRCCENSSRLSSAWPLHETVSPLYGRQISRRAPSSS